MLSMEAIKKAHKLADGNLSVNTTLLPSTSPLDYEAYAIAAAEEGTKVLKTVEIT